MLSNSKYMDIKHANAGNTTRVRAVAPVKSAKSKQSKGKEYGKTLHVHSLHSNVAKLMLYGEGCNMFMLQMFSLGGPNYRPAELVFYEPELCPLAQMPY